MSNNSFRDKFFRRKSSSTSVNLASPTGVDSLQSTLNASKFLLCCEQGDLSTLRTITRHYDDELSSLINHEDSKTHKNGLIYAAINGHVHIVTELIELEADIELCHDGSTPLYHAVSRGHIDIVKVLLSHNANVNAINNKGWTCLMNAAYFGRDDIVRLLLQHRADPDIVRSDFDGKSALHYASKNGRYEVVELLLDYGADPNVADRNDNTTPLMYAARHGFEHIIQLLILYGANPLMTNAHQQTAIDFLDPIPLKDGSKEEIESDHKTDAVITGNAEERALNSQQNVLYSVMRESNMIYGSICKLVRPPQMRSLLRSLHTLYHSYPALRGKIMATDKIADLRHIFKKEMAQFMVLCGSEIRDHFQLLRPYDVESEIHGDGDRSSSYELVLRKFKKRMVGSTQQCQAAQDDVLNKQEDVQRIQRDIINKTKSINTLMAEISSLQRKLVQQEQEKMDLQREMELEQLNGELLSEALVEKQQRLQVDSQLFEMMSKATTNIESLCDKAERVPDEYRSALQNLYYKKQKAIESRWKTWDLDDIISWICGLDLKGKFERYRRGLQKLSELEEDHDDLWIDEDGDGAENENSGRLNGGGRMQAEGQNEEESDLDPIITQILSNGVNDERTGQSIFEVINDSVLKMCGVRDPRDRKVILMNIESLKKEPIAIMEEVADELEMKSNDNGIDADDQMNNDSEFIMDAELGAEGAMSKELASSTDDDDDNDNDDGKEEEEMIAMEDMVDAMDNIGDVIEEELNEDLFVEEQINDKFLCPITKKIMTDPVICADGYSYERSAIEKWLLDKDVSPVTEQALATKQLFPNQNLRMMIEESKH